jgi:hypothetical protein
LPRKSLDAFLYSAGANKSHGLPRTNADKRRAVELLLADEEWKGWADRAIGRHAGVHNDTVASARKRLSDENRQIEPTTRLVERGGTTYTQDTSDIGKKREIGAHMPNLNPVQAAKPISPTL